MPKAMLIAIAILTTITAHAAPSMAVDDLPAELTEWTDWALAGHEDHACLLLDGAKSCVWPSVVHADVNVEGADLIITATADASTVLPLPGGRGQWPQNVRVDGQHVVVSSNNGVPFVTITPGTHRVTARINWSVIPSTLKMPAQTGRVALVVNGERVAWPHREASGSVRLGAGETATTMDESMTMDVSRRIKDGVPVVVRTRLAFRASGSAREVDLGDVLVAGTSAVSLTANLPARFTDDGHLVLQVRPGNYTVTFDAISKGEVGSLMMPSVPSPWPTTEYWAVAQDDTVRAVTLSGGQGIDPNRTTTPDDWRSLPTFSFVAGDVLTFTEQQRGEPVPAANDIRLRRTIWMDATGDGYTVQDAISGKMSQGWRLDAVAPMVLGRVNTKPADQMVSVSEDGLAGVEIRARSLHVTADARIDEAIRVFPAVGWNTDVQSLQAQLNLPPGWALFTAFGADTVKGSLLGEWSLMDLLFVLIVSLSIAKRYGREWGVVALVGLALSRHQPDAPEWSLAALVVVSAVSRIAKGRVAVVGTNVLRGTMMLTLIVVLAPFAVSQVESALFPVLENTGQTDFDGSLLFDTKYEGFNGSAEEESLDLSAPKRMKEASGSGRGGESLRYSSRYQDDNFDRKRSVSSALVQTGPGLPTWTWNRIELGWSGPVAKDQTLRLVLLAPWFTLLLALLRVIALIAVTVRLSDVRPTRKTVVSALILLPLMFGLGTNPALADTPDASVLKELTARLTAPPACAPNCVMTSALSLDVKQGILTTSATVHAQSLTSWSLLGPTSAWVPTRVTVDGKPAPMRRSGEGFLQVRVPKGIHTVVAMGPLPSHAAVTLQVADQPKVTTFTGSGWTIEGLKADGTMEKAIQLVRAVDVGRVASPQNSSDNLVPWLEVRRSLDFGLPWRVETEVVRTGPVSAPLSLKVPLLAGERVTTAGIEVDDDRASVVFQRDQRRVVWLSTLDEREVVSLTAAKETTYTERWEFVCSPIYSCSYTGINPVRHSSVAGWSPLYLPWPGEQVTVALTRPAAIAGQTKTIDKASLTVEPGKRQMSAVLALRVRSSQGGRQLVTLPTGAKLNSVLVNGQERSIQLDDNGGVPLPLQPGTTNFEVRWQQALKTGFINTVPAVDLGSPAVNIDIIVKPMSERWLVLLFGPSWGPVPLFWTYFVLVLGLAPLLGRLRWTPLASWQWALLGLGMTQVPVIVPMFIVLWLVAIGVRKARPPQHWFVFNLSQLALVGLTFLAVIALYACIHTGLLVQPDMQVSGNNSTDALLHWYLDRSDGKLPQPTIISTPLWVWRVIMLVWSLWLANAIVKLTPWAWDAFTTGGLYKMAPKRVVEVLEE